MSVPETETRGPDHSLYPKVVSPSKMTWKNTNRLAGEIYRIHRVLLMPYLCSLVQSSEIEGRSGGDGDIVQSDGRAGLLGLDSGGGALGAGEGATRRPAFQRGGGSRHNVRCRGSLDRGCAEKGDEAKLEAGNHGEYG